MSMIATGDILTGVIAGVLSGKLLDTVDKIFESDQYTHDDKVELLLASIAVGVAPKEKDNFNRAFALQPYPYETTASEDWHGRPHFCVFFHDQTPVRIDIEGLGTYLKTVGPGWVQCDVRGRFSTTDSQNHNVMFSYRYDALGAAL